MFLDLYTWRGSLLVQGALISNVAVLTLLQTSTVKPTVFVDVLGKERTHEAMGYKMMSTNLAVILSLPLCGKRKFITRNYRKRTSPTLWLVHTARDRERDREWEMMGFSITLCTVHTTQGQGQGTIVFYCAHPSPSPCTSLFSHNLL